MAVVGEAFLSAAFQSVIENLATPILREFGCRLGVEKELKKLTRTLSKIHSVLNDAEAKQISDMSVKLWLADLKEVAHDVEDVLDEVSTEAFRYNQQKKVTNLLSLSKDFIFKLGLAPKIREINERLDEIAKEKDDLDLREGVRVTLTETRSRERLQTSSLIDESHVFGRADDKKKLVELLVSSESRGNDGGVGVIPIIGMGGLGKTTVAQLVFGDSLVAETFELKAWICVSDDFNVQRLTKSILESIDKKPCDLVDLDNLQTSLRNRLRGRKFLVVLDDVWNEKGRDWEVLRLPFIAGATGSKIIVTSRSENVASIMGTCPPYRLDVLSAADCWLLFKQRAFVSGNEDEHPNLVPIGKKILQKCKGLPLAAKALGGLLHAKTDVSQWEIILQSDIWELKEEENEILPALRLSYNQLPAHLKQCFAYCSIFPKDYLFNKEDLVLLWMAEGFIHPKGSRSLEDIASDCFDDLLLRSFFQQAQANLSKFVMHDLIHDLAQSIAGEICFTLDGEKLQNIPEKVWHLSVLVDTLTLATFEDLHVAKGLRTLLLLFNKFSQEEASNVKVPHDFLCSLGCLRSLDMSYISIKDLPDPVGDLMHMRYLNLSYTGISKLPESIGNLCNLQTLILTNCKKLLNLPRGTKNLAKLRHLNLTGCWHLKSIPPSFGKLTSLQRLHRFVIGKEAECGINELKNMNDLRATLCIDRVEDVNSVEDAKEASLNSKQYIRKLELRWSRSRYDQGAIDEGLLEFLEPHTNLRELIIDAFPGRNFPNWMGNSLLCNLENIEFTLCNYCKTLPPLGQLPFLRSLTIRIMQELGSIGREFYGEGKIKGFPSLQNLKLEEMKNLTDWQEIDDGEFPALQQLALLNCPKVANLPKFPSLKELLLDDCHQAVLNSVRFFTSLSSLEIVNFRRTDFLPDGLLQSLTALKELKIQQLYRLQALQEDTTSIQRLEIICCPKLMSFGQRGLPHVLQYLSIRMCSNVKDLPTSLEILSSLQELVISNCPKFTSFLEIKLPKSIKHLRISACANLESLPRGLHELINLESLSIACCPKLASLPVSGLPCSLRTLSIWECSLLEGKCGEGGEHWPQIRHIPHKLIGLGESNM